MSSSCIFLVEKYFSILVDGGWKTWEEWGACSATCNGGSKERTRVCDTPEPDYEGYNCEGDDTQLQTCNTHPCPSKLSFII